jgi:hypothetical protein
MHKGTFRFPYAYFLLCTGILTDSKNNQTLSVDEYIVLVYDYSVFVKKLPLNFCKRRIVKSSY